MLSSLCIWILNQGLNRNEIMELSNNVKILDIFMIRIKMSWIEISRERLERIELKLVCFHLLGMNCFCWMWLFSALCRSAEIFDAKYPMKLDTIGIPLSHVKRYLVRQLWFDEHHAILDPFQIWAEVNRMLVMLPGSLEFVMPLMHSNDFYLCISSQRKHKIQS